MLRSKPKLMHGAEGISSRLYATRNSDSQDSEEQIDEETVVDDDDISTPRRQREFV
jgi:hypothetical protein